MNCQIYDTAGQEIYNSLSARYYKRANAILLVYDISQKKTFEKIKNYYVKEIKNNCDENVIILLIANKADLENEREVTTEEGINLAKEQNYEYKESSCLQNKNVAGAFEYLVETWNFRKQTKKEQNPSAPNKSMVRQNSRIELAPNKGQDKKEKKGCCS